jgi:putative transposase
MKTEAWTERKENLSRYDISAHLPAWKKAEETAWLSEVNSQSLQSALVNLEAAYTRFFREKKGFPKFKSKHHRQSFQVPQSGAVGDGFVKIPKVGQIKAVISREIVGTIKTITISRTSTGKYFASVLCDDGLEAPAKMPVTEAGTVGIDLGLKDFAVLSTGERVANPRNIKRAEKKLRRAQRRLSRRVKGSRNRDKQRRKVARVHEKVANRRKDFLQKTTTRLVADNQSDSFAIEDLAVGNMLQNRRLAKAISDAGWATFRTLLESKAERAGKNVLVIGRWEPSSKACSCGIVNKELKLSDRVWSCVCGATHDRDLLAANNIKRFALHPRNSLPQEMRESTPVEIVARRSSKQESPCL